MSINRVAFLLFLLVGVVAYYLTPKRFRWLVLLAASIGFYLSYGVAPALYLGVTILVTYLFGQYLGRLSAARPNGRDPETRAARKTHLTRKKRWVLAAALVLNFAVLGVLKYSGFVVENINRILLRTGQATLALPSFLLPLGISFFIFQTSGYLIDVYRGKYLPESNLARYALFVCYFPQMVQGPINRYDAISSALYEGNDFDWENIQGGILRMIYGILKKALIADQLAIPVQMIYAGYADYPGVVSFLGAALYCIQLYCDFSGGIDLLCGASRLFGVPMSENFCRPYFATSLADFWRRWHISLGEWMKDYLFYPLTLSKASRSLTKRARNILPADFAKRVTPCLATITVFLCVGIWQGPGWFNIAYGLWNGMWMSLGLLWAPISRRLFKRFSWDKSSHVWIIWGVIRTNFLVIIGRYLSNASSLRSAWGMLRRTFTAPGFGGVNATLFHSIGLDWETLMTVCAALVVLFCVSLAQEKGVDVSRWLCERKWYIQLLVLFLCLFLVVCGVYGNSDYTPITYVYENV